MHSTLESIHNIRLRVLTSYYSGSTLASMLIVSILYYDSYTSRIIYELVLVVRVKWIIQLLL